MLMVLFVWQWLLLSMRLAAASHGPAGCYQLIKVLGLTQQLRASKHPLVGGRAMAWQQARLHAPSGGEVACSTICLGPLTALALCTRCTLFIWRAGGRGVWVLHCVICSCQSPRARRFVIYIGFVIAVLF